MLRNLLIIGLTSLITSLTFGQTKVKKIDINLEPTLTLIYNAQGFKSCGNGYLLFSKKENSLNPSNSKLLGCIGFNFTPNFNFGVSSGLEYYYKMVETHGKFIATFDDKPNYYFAPQLGLGILKHKLLFLIGYNILLNKSTALNELGGLTFTIGYRLKLNKSD